MARTWVSRTVFTPGVVAWWLSGAAVDLDFQTPRYYDGADGADVATLLSCSRASIGYAQTVAGTLTQFLSNVLRITDKGLLIEDAETNYASHSQDLAGLPSSGTTVVDNQLAAPDGTTTASKLTEDSSNARHISFGSPGTPGGIANGVTYAYSCYLKQGTRRWAGINLVDNTATNLGSAVIDLQTGLITQTSGSNYTSSYVETLANGWYRLVLILTGNGTSGGGENAVIFSSDSGTPTLSQGSATYTGDGTSFFYAWGRQIEIGTFASSYIPTTTSSAVRAADVVTTAGALQTVIAAAAGSIVTQVDSGEVAGLAANIVDSNGTNLLGFNSSNNGLSSITSTLTTANAGNRTSQDKLGLAWSAGGRSLVLNSGTVATDAVAQTPDSTQHLGSSGAANFAFAYIERLTAWSSKLADATLQGFTA